MIKKTMMIAIMVLLVLTGCTQPESSIVDENEPTPQPLDEAMSIVDELELNEKEAAYLANLKEAGVLKIASREIETVLKNTGEGYTGFNYNTIKKFADDAGLELDVTIVDNIEVFFYRDGYFDDTVKTDPSMTYKPDLFNDVDVYVDTLTQLSWREKLMDFIGFTPIRELVIRQPEVDIENIYDMNGKTVAVQSVSSYMSTFTDIEETYGIRMKYVYVDTIFDALRAVDEKTADFTIMDSNRAFLEAKKLDNIEVGIPVTDVKYVGWAVSKDTPELRSILTKYMDVLIERGIINDLWLTDYEISFYEYYTLILKDASVIEAMNLTREELAYIDNLRKRGNVRIALQNNVVGYNPDAQVQTGYNYLLAEDFAKVIGVDLEMVIVDQFTRFFWKNGETPEEVKTNSAYFYVPDLFEEVDIYADNLTHLPWRSQILNQIEGVPVSTVVVQKKGSQIESMKDLDGMTVALNRDTSYEVVLNNIVKDQGIQVEIYDVFNDVGAYEAVIDGQADVTITDSDLAFLILRDYPDLEIVLQASKTQFLGWAVKKEDDVLASILTKYMEAMKANGKFDQYWETTYGVSYPEYMRLLTD